MSQTSESSSLSNPDLLDYDKSSDDEEILGERFNIPYNNRFIPGNKIHKVFAATENNFRKKVYEKTNGKTKNTGESMFEYYEKIEKEILEKQENLREEKREFKNRLGRNICESPQEIQELKNTEDYEREKGIIIKRLQEAIGYRQILEVEPCEEQPHRVYPNYAIAGLSYIKDNNVLFRLIRDESDSTDGHSEKILFNSAYNLIEKDKSIQNSDLIVLNLHTTLSMCDDCYNEAKELIERVNTLTKRKDNFKINVSYNFPYQNGIISEGDGENLFQKQVEIVISDDESLIDKIVPSSGYKNSPIHAKAIKELLSSKSKNEKD